MAEICTDPQVKYYGQALDVLTLAAVFRNSSSEYPSTLVKRTVRDWPQYLT